MAGKLPTSAQVNAMDGTYEVYMQFDKTIDDYISAAFELFKVDLFRIRKTAFADIFAPATDIDGADIGTYYDEMTEMQIKQALVFRTLSLIYNEYSLKPAEDKGIYKTKSNEFRADYDSLVLDMRMSTADEPIEDQPNDWYRTL
jgi:hypothetical protein